MRAQSQLPKVTSQTDSIPLGSSATITVPVPSGETWEIGQIITTLGANTTIDTNGIRIDGVTVGLNSASLNLETEFGRLAVANDQVEVDVTSTDAGAQNTTVAVRHTIL